MKYHRFVAYLISLAFVVNIFAVIVNFFLIIAVSVWGMKSMRNVKKPDKDFNELKRQVATNDYLYSIGIECGYAKSSLGQTDCKRDLSDFFKSPVVKFHLHCASYGVYLFIFAYFLF